MVKFLEWLVFKLRSVILLGLLGLTVWTGYHAVQLKIDAGFEKLLPASHPYIATFQEYRDQLFGANRIIVVLKAREGTIWNKEFISRLKDLTDEIFFLPGIDRRTVTSLWTPNTRYFEITEEGFRADDVIPGTVTAESLTPDAIEQIQNNVIRGGYVGHLVANDFTSAMITAELIERDPRTGEKVNYRELGVLMEQKLRDRFEDDEFSVHIIGFAKNISSIIGKADNVVGFFVVAFLLTALAVYWYARSLILTFLPLLCSLVSLIWQFGLLHVLGFGLDPLAILVPFLVFAIGVSHGVQQINLISKEIESGKTANQAARSSFTGLLIPGSMALTTDLVGFGTLYFVDIPMIKELAITASIGVALKIVTNLIMLPLLVSYFKFDEGYVGRVHRAREFRLKIMRKFGVIAEPRVAVVIFMASVVIFATAIYQSQGRHVGDLHAGSPELRPEARYNVDSRIIEADYSIGLNLLTVVVETPSESCIKYPQMDYMNRFSWYLTNVEGVGSVASAAFVAKAINAGWNEGNLKWHALPRNQFALVQATAPISPSTGLLNANCTILPLHIFTEDSRATTLQRVVSAVKTWRTETAAEAEELGMTIRLASGNAGVIAATNEEVERAEVPMMIAVYIVIILMVFGTYRDWRATLACCLPLSVATFCGYWFMKELEIGLKVATLPVMVLAVGLGVDYAFYIYNRIQFHLSEGKNITRSYQETMSETGMAVVFTAITLAIGVSTWVFSGLKFQADMGTLLTFMFMTNMIMAITALPALAVVLDIFFPRSRLPRPPAGAHP
ncbi:MAG: efflux RND transporter permease subunit [Alphaproteobacteria bacterium]